MTYAELFKAMCDRLPSGEGFNIEVSTWRHEFTGIETEWSIYVTREGVHHRGETPEHALAEYDRENDLAKSEPIEKTSERVGGGL